ncbi:MAG: hypothetical protein ACI819_002105, partial [Neolewinella sp.]
GVSLNSSERELLDLGVSLETFLYTSGRAEKLTSTSKSP